MRGRIWSGTGVPGITVTSTGPYGAHRTSEMAYYFLECTLKVRCNTRNPNPFDGLMRAHVELTARSFLNTFLHLRYYLKDAFVQMWLKYFNINFTYSDFYVYQVLIQVVGRNLIHNAFKIQVKTRFISCWVITTTNISTISCQLHNALYLESCTYPEMFFSTIFNFHNF